MYILLGMTVLMTVALRCCLGEAVAYAMPDGMRSLVVRNGLHGIMGFNPVGQMLG